MKKIVLLTFLVALTFTCFATHNRAGEITYKHISGYRYKIIVTTYTKESSTQADKCSLTIHFGDSDTAIFNRVNGPKTSICGGTIPAGENVGPDIKKNIYEGEHTYPGPGEYTITMEDPNRNANICNFGGSASDQLSFFLKTVLKINSFMPANSSPTLLNPPIDNGCVGECFEHNPGAYDAEGDSLYYALVKCYANGQEISVFQYPDNMSPSSINPYNGDIIWCVPTTSCQYNIAILITEYRLFAGKRYFVGSVLRDMQIDIGPCQNRAPVIRPVNDTCIEANKPLNFTVYAEDPDKDNLTLTATGGPFLMNPKATFTAKDTIQKIKGHFSWTPNCSQVQLLPYQVTFKVSDNKTKDELVNFESVFIRVIAPAVTGLTVTPNGTSMELKWNQAFCHDTSGTARLKRYDIYRKNSCDPWVHGPCETGVPASLGYTLIGSTSYRVTNFQDTNNGLGLIHGIEYSYIVVAHYLDESESYASVNVCAHLVRDVPIITNVSVLQTDAASGKIWIHWAKPLGIAPNLDTVNNPPPYKFVLQQSVGYTGAALSEISTYTYPAYWQLTDTGFVSTLLNTQDSAYSYRVDFYANGLLKGSTHVGSSVFLKTVSSDNALTLNWQMDVPWTNYLYYISKETPTGSGVYKLIDSTKKTTYTDKGLVNNVLYCYRVTSVGAYADTSLPKPLYNHSQIRCDKPGDQTPPCQPELTLNTKCDVESNVLNWLNPNTYCSDDALSYNIYYSPNSEEALKLIATITDINQTSFPYVNDFYGVRSVAGCYAVTAVDSFNNESPIVKISCVDNCPYYELPNVFTPNGDSHNDVFTPLPNYRFVKDIEIKIYDRWGLLMFETNDINIQWNGTNAKNKLPCPSGTYYYICTVNEIKLSGIVPRVIRGFIELLQEEAKPQK